MTSLLDIGPLTEEVEIRGGFKLTVQGLTAGHLFQLFSEFPDMRKMLGEKKGSPQEIMLALAPELICKVIATATGTPGNKEAEAKAMTMGADDQLSIISAIVRLSFRDGIGPFVERVTALMNSTKMNQGTVSKLSSESTTRSPAHLSASLQMDTPDLMRGGPRRAN